MCGSIGGIDIADPADFSGRRRRKDAKKVQDAAAAAEAARQARISGNVTDINTAFGGREDQYTDFVSAIRELYGADLGRQQQEAARQSKFSLARGGLTGGSAAVDAGRTLSREANEGTLTAERRAQKQLADLRGMDESARLSMISLAQSGNDIGNAASQTASALRANLEGARAAGTTEGLGDVFGRTAATYRAQQDAAARRRGLKEANLYAGPFSRGDT